MKSISKLINDGLPGMLQGWVSEADARPAKKALLSGNGYTPFTYLADMVRPDLENIPEPFLPDGIEVRPVKPEHYRAIFDADEETSRLGQT